MNCEHICAYYSGGIVAFTIFISLEGLSYLSVVKAMVSGASTLGGL